MSWFKRFLGGSGEARAAAEQLEALIAEGEAYLTDQMMVHQRIWQLGSETGVDFDPRVGVLTLSFDGGRQVRCPISVVGTMDTQSGLWAWAWANTSIPEDLRRAVATVKDHGERHGFARLTTPEWPATEEWAWKMTAVAAKLCGHRGAYALQMGPLQMFLMFREVQLDRPVPLPAPDELNR